MKEFDRKRPRKLKHSSKKHNAKQIQVSAPKGRDLNDYEWALRFNFNSYHKLNRDASDQQQKPLSNIEMKITEQPDQITFNISDLLSTN